MFGFGTGYVELQRWIEVQPMVLPDLISCSHVVKSFVGDSLWSMSMHFLRTIERQRKLDTILYNNALNTLKISRWTWMFHLLDRMSCQRSAPDVVSYGTAICSPKTWPLALQLVKYRDPGGSGGHQKGSMMTSYNAAIAVSSWTSALQLAGDLESQGNSLETITYNCMISKVDVWHKAMQLLLPLERKLQSSPVSYGALLSCSSWTKTLALLKTCCRRGILPSTIIWPKALDLLQQMRPLDVHPNLITYNGFMDVCQKTGEWRVALQLLEVSTADCITYNSIIAACQASGELMIALSLLAEMQVQRLFAVVVTYNSAIAVCQRRGNWTDALQLLNSMCHVQLLPDVISYSSILSVCEAAATWTMALRVLEDFEPDLFSFNSAISACDKGGQLSLARGLLDTMLQAAVLPDVVTFNGLLSASAKDREWWTTLQFLSKMHAFSQPRNIITYNSAIHACSEIWVLSLKFLGSLTENRISSDLITYGSLLSGLQTTAQWRRAIHMALDQQNMITCEILANACDAGNAFLPLLRFLSTIEPRALCRLLELPDFAG
eukprot:symbB.v1.2.031694.t1/scaffold3708.1/size51654/2